MENIASVPDFPKANEMTGYPVLNSMYNSDNKIERYWVNKCVDKLKELNLCNGQYLSRLEEEADIKRTISEKLETNMFELEFNKLKTDKNMTEIAIESGFGSLRNFNRIYKKFSGKTPMEVRKEKN